MSTAPRKDAPRLARPAARYWKGKAPKGAAEVQSDSDEDEDNDEQLEQQEDVALGGEFLAQEGDEDDLQLRTVDESKPIKSMNISLREVDISKDGKVIVAGREESGRTALEEEEGMAQSFEMYCSSS